MTTLVFFLFFALLAAGMSGTIPIYRDSGDLISSVSTLGIAHPPGYPLYALLGRLFQCVLPFGNLSYKLNLFSAFCAAGAVALLYSYLSRISRVGALSAVVVFAMSPAFVALGRVSEMYALALCLSVLILTLAARKTPQAFAASFFVLGLSMGVHSTLILLAPALWWGLPPPRAGEAQTRFLPALLFFLVGSSIILYLPIRAFTNPLFNWGDPSSLRNFWRVLTRADYGGWKLHPTESSLATSSEAITVQIQFFIHALKEEWGWGGLAIAVGGFIAVLRRTKNQARLWSAAASFLLAGPLFFLLSNLPVREATSPAILQPYLLLPGVFIAIALAYGIAALWEKQKAWAVAALIGAALTLPKPGWNFSERNDFLAYDYGRNLLRALPPQAVLYDPDDPTSFTIRALQVTENRRPDVIPLNFFRTRWGYEHIRRYTSLLPSDTLITNAQELDHVLWTYSRLTHPFYAELPQKFGDYPYASEGLVYAVYPKNPRLSLARAEANLQLMVRHDFSQTTDHADFFARHLLTYYAAAQCNLGLDDTNAGLFEAAIFHYRYALTIDPTMIVAYNNWGSLAYQRKNYKEAVALYRAGLAVDGSDVGLQKNLQMALDAARAAPLH